MTARTATDAGLAVQAGYLQRIEGGGWGENRTPDTRIFSPLLYQLSYPAVERASTIPGLRLIGKRFLKIMRISF